MNETINHLREAAKILGVTADDYTEQGIKKKFRDLAKIKHPDVGGTDEEFMTIANAYDTLLIACRRGVLVFPSAKAEEIDAVFGTGIRGRKNVGNMPTYEEVAEDIENFDFINYPEPIRISFGQYIALCHEMTVYVLVDTENGKLLKALSPRTFEKCDNVVIFTDISVTTETRGNVETVQLGIELSVKDRGLVVLLPMCAKADVITINALGVSNCITVKKLFKRVTEYQQFVPIADYRGCSAGLYITYKWG